ncbi:MAG: hypothetical protein V3R62_11730, partial [Acidiferrobacterales bacterium]
KNQPPRGLMIHESRIADLQLGERREEKRHKDEFVRYWGLRPQCCASGQLGQRRALRDRSLDLFP